MVGSPESVKAAKGRSARSKLPSDPTADAARALPVIIGRNLKRLRTQQGYSLERLARLTGVSRAMLSQIETGKSVPTISLLVKVANGLGVAVANLLAAPEARRMTVLPKARARVLTASGGQFTARGLFPARGEHRVEFYEVRVGSGHTETVEPYAAGTRVNVVVVEGEVELVVGKEPPVLLAEGDAALFHADVPHVWRNPKGRPAALYMVVSFLDAVAR